MATKIKIEKICRNCKHWNGPRHRGGFDHPSRGICERMQNMVCMNYGDGNRSNNGGIYYYCPDRLSFADKLDIDVFTDENFGCVLFEPVENKGEK